MGFPLTKWGLEVQRPGHGPRGSDAKSVHGCRQFFFFLRARFEGTGPFQGFKREDYIVEDWTSIFGGSRSLDIQFSEDMQLLHMPARLMRWIHLCLACT